MDRRFKKIFCTIFITVAVSVLFAFSAFAAEIPSNVTCPYCGDQSHISSNGHYYSCDGGGKHPRIRTRISTTETVKNVKSDGTVENMQTGLVGGTYVWQFMSAEGSVPGYSSYYGPVSGSVINITQESYHERLSENVEQLPGYSFLKKVFQIGDDDDSVLSADYFINRTNQIILDVMDELSGSGTLGSIYFIIKALGIVILIIMFAVEMSTKDYALSQQMTPEMIYKPWLRFFVALIFIIFGLPLFKGVWAMMTSIFLKLPESVNFASIVADVPTLDSTDGMILDILGEAGLKTDPKGTLDKILNSVSVLPVYLNFFLPWIVSTACDLVIGWVICSRCVNVILNMLIAPLSMGDLATETNIRNTDAFRFLKSFAGLCFQIVVIQLVLITTRAIMGAVVSGGTTNTEIALQITIFKLVQVGCLIGSASTAKRVFGSN